MEENIFDTEIGKKILALTKASFRVSDLISDLILREKVKHQILTVFEKFLFIYEKKNPIQNLEKSYAELLREINILDHYFYLGGHLNLVKEEHLKALRNGFLVFKSHIILALNNANSISQKAQSNKSDDSEQIDFSITSENSMVGIEPERGNLTAKHKKILEKFEDKNTLKLSEVMEILPNLSEKTVRNELADLINLGKITRSGTGNGSFYKLVR